MAKITKEQIQRINEKCSNGWRLDVEYYLYHSEKTLVKQIKIDGEHYLEFELLYNWKNQISLHIRKFHHKQGDFFASSEGLGKNRILNEIQVARKKVNDLIEFTKSLTDEALMEINENTEVTKSSIFVPSNEF